MFDTEKLIRHENQNVYRVPKFDVSEDQSQTAEVFGFMWDDGVPYTNVDNNTVEYERAEQDRISDGNFSRIIDEYFKNAQGKKVDFLDLGCGLGYTINIVFGSYLNQMKYTGLDVHPHLEKTHRYIGELYKAAGAPEDDYTIIRASMNDLPEIRERFDFVWAQGTMHHSESVESAINEVTKVIKKNGKFLFWIIGEQKPLRRVTDQFFRDALKDIPLDEVYQEMIAYSKFAMTLGELLGDQKIKIEDRISILDLDPGEYKAQQLLYDYVFKFYFNDKLSLERTAHQHFDWFAPSFYHQTSREDLSRMLTENGFEFEMWQKTNGFAVNATYVG